MGNKSSVGKPVDVLEMEFPLWIDHPTAVLKATQFALSHQHPVEFVEADGTKWRINPEDVLQAVIPYCQRLSSLNKVDNQFAYQVLEDSFGLPAEA